MIASGVAHAAGFVCVLARFGRPEAQPRGGVLWSDTPRKLLGFSDDAAGAGPGYLMLQGESGVIPVPPPGVVGKINITTGGLAPPPLPRVHLKEAHLKLAVAARPDGS